MRAGFARVRPSRACVSVSRASVSPLRCLREVSFTVEFYVSVTNQLMMLLVLQLAAGITLPAVEVVDRCPPGKGGLNCSVSGPSVVQLLKWHDPYAGIKLLPNLLTGWSQTRDETYAEMVGLSHATVAVEIGVWRGLSASLIAGAMQRRGQGGVLFAVDTWLGAVEFWNLRLTGGMPDPERDLFLKNGYPSVYYNF